MQIESVIAVRRSLLRGTLALFGVAASGAAEAGQRPARRRNREQTLRERATAHVYAQFGQHGAVIVGPISLLQREYHLGYQGALELAAQLEEDAVWTVFRDASGMRCARRSARSANEGALGCHILTQGKFTTSNQAVG